MGGCAMCREVKKSRAEQTIGNHPDIEEESEADELSDEAGDPGSSDEEEAQLDYKDDVEDILINLANGLKRGRTMAMKEAIGQAKKTGIDPKKIAAAEHRLDEHKRSERALEVEKEVDAFFASELKGDIKTCERLLKKTHDAECWYEVIKKVQVHLDMLIVTRPLEDEEVDKTREYLKMSCREFVHMATVQGGRSMIAVRDGKKMPSLLTLDAALQNMYLMLMQDGGLEEAKGCFEAPMTTVRVFTPKLLDGRRTEVHQIPKRGSEALLNQRSFRHLEEDDLESALGVRFYKDGFKSEECVWIFLEPTKAARDRLFEAFVVLIKACNA